MSRTEFGSDPVDHFPDETVNDFAPRKPSERAHAQPTLLIEIDDLERPVIIDGLLYPVVRHFSENSRLGRPSRGERGSRILKWQSNSAPGCAP